MNGKRSILASQGWDRDCLCSAFPMGSGHQLSAHGKLFDGRSHKARACKGLTPHTTTGSSRKTSLSLFPLQHSITLPDFWHRCGALRFAHCSHLAPCCWTMLCAMTQCSVPRGNALCRGATLYAVGRHSVPWGDDAPQLRQRSGLGDRSLLPPPLPPPHVCPPCPPLPPRRQLQRSLPADAAAGGTDGALGDTCLGFILAPNLHYFTRQPGTYQRHPHGTQWGGKKPPQNPTATNPPPASRALRRAASALPHLRAAKGDLSDGNQIPRSPPAAAPLPPRSDRRSAASRPRANGCSALPTRCHSSRSALQTVLFFVCKGLRSASPPPPIPST